MKYLPPYAQLLKLRAEEHDGRLRFVMPFHDDVVGRPGFLHGGAIAGLLEFAAFTALSRAIGDGVVKKPVTVTVDYMRGGTPQDTFAEAVIDGDRVWLSGVVAGLRKGETMADAEASYDRAWQMLGDVLTRSGSSFDGVVDITTYHTDLPAQFDGFRKVKDRYIREPFPAWTAIDIDRLVPDNGLVEIKLVARRSPKD